MQEIDNRQQSVQISGIFNNNKLNIVLLPRTASIMEKRGAIASTYTQIHHRITLIFLFLSTALLLAIVPADSYAIQASPYPFEVTQPDGSRVMLYIRGDEYFNWSEDMNGYTVVRANGKYVYAQLNKLNRLMPTAWEVGKVNPKDMGLSRKILPPGKDIKQIRQLKRAAAIDGSKALQTAPPQAVSALGTVKNLVILVRFSNHSNRILPSNPDFSVLFNQPGGDSVLAPTGSVRDVYSENSYGQLDLQSTIVGWIDVSNTEQYYANGVSGDSTLWQALTEALDSADASIDFSDFDSDGDGYIDAITFVHSGYGAEWGGVDADGVSFENRIWSHKWRITPEWVSAEGVRVNAYNINPGLWNTSGSDIGRIGVIAHELGHFLGLPDLYDTDGTSEGIGSWGLMANSWGFDSNQLHPPHFSPWSKIQLDWVIPTLVSTAGVYNLSQVETNADVIRIDGGFPAGEYLLLENRQPAGIESIIPQGGIAIWHIDERKPDNTEEGFPGQAGWPGNNRHYRIALLQADANYDLERNFNRGDGGDLFHGLGIDTIGAATVPGTDSYQDGIVAASGIEIANIGQSGTVMSLSIDVPPPPGACSTGTTPAFVFQDDLENINSGNWVNTVGTGINHWNGGAGTPDIYFSLNPNSGSYALRGRDYAQTGDSSVEMANDILLPDDAFMAIQHEYDIENDWDGGVIEYSTDGGASWLDANSLIASRGYTALLNSSTNPLGIRLAYSGRSGGYLRTLLDLNTLAGQQVRFRFRLGTDDSIGATGWDIDDIEVYYCQNNNQAPILGLIDDPVIDEGASMTIPLTATDPDGNNLSFSASGLPSFAILTDNGNGTGSLQIDPQPGDAGTYPVNITVSDNGMPVLIDTQAITITINAAGSGQTPFGGIPWPIPGQVEMEDYDLGGDGVAYHDLTIGNRGNTYRSDDVDIWLNGMEGYYTGGNSSGEWLEFTVDVAAAGNYQLELRYATPNSNRKLHVEFDGIDVSGAITLPNSGGWQTWQTISVPVTLNAGQQVMRVSIDGNGMNLNWLRLTASSGGTNQTPVLNQIGTQTIDEGVMLSFPVSASDDGPASELRMTASGLPSGATFSDNGNGNASFDWSPSNGTAGTYNVTFMATDLNGTGLSVSEVVPIIVTSPGGGQTPFGGTPWPIPGQLEMEDYDLGGDGVAYHDVSAGNRGNTYRSDDVDIWLNGMEGYYTGGNRPGEWLEFTVDVAAAGNYQLQLRFATPNSNRKLHVEFDGIDVSGAITLPNTGSWQNWQTINVPVTLNAGRQIMRLAIDTGGMNLNWVNVQ